MKNKNLDSTMNQIYEFLSFQLKPVIQNHFLYVSHVKRIFVAFVSPTLSENWIPRILLSFIKLEIQYITNTLHQQRDP